MYKPIQYINEVPLNPEVNYVELNPSSYLSNFVSCYWIVEAKKSEVKSISHRILPDGCIDIVFDFIEQRAFICGIADKTENLILDGRVKYLGIRFLPQTISYIFKSDTASSLNVRLALDNISKILSKMSAIVLENNNLSECLNIIEYNLSSFFKDYKINERFKVLLDHALDSRGVISVKGLSKYHYISEKQIGRYFINNTGISTKSFLRILRFQNAFKNIATYKRSSISLALDAGYYDQSHLIKDLKYFLGSIKNIY